MIRRLLNQRTSIRSDIMSKRTAVHLTSHYSVNSLVSVSRKLLCGSQSQHSGPPNLGSGRNRVAPFSYGTQMPKLAGASRAKLRMGIFVLCSLFLGYMAYFLSDVGVLSRQEETLQMLFAEYGAAIFYLPGNNTFMRDAAQIFSTYGTDTVVVDISNDTSMRSHLTRLVGRGSFPMCFQGGRFVGSVSQVIVNIPLGKESPGDIYTCTLADWESKKRGSVLGLQKVELANLP